MPRLRDESKGGGGSARGRGGRGSGEVSGGADDATLGRAVVDLDQNGEGPIPRFSTQRWYRLLERVESKLNDIDTSDRNGLVQIGNALKSAREAQAIASRLLRGSTSAWSRSKKASRAAKKILALKIREALRDPKNTEVQEREDGKPRPQGERVMIAEAQLFSLREEADDLEDLAEAWGSFRECVKTTLQSIRAYRADINKYLSALTEMRETGLSESEGD